MKPSESGLPRRRGQSPRLPAGLRDPETPVRRFLEHYEVPRSVIEQLEAHGIRTVHDLLRCVREGDLEPALGPARREHREEIERVLGEQR